TIANRPLQLRKPEPTACTIQTQAGTGDPQQAGANPQKVFINAREGPYQYTILVNRDAPPDSVVLGTIQDSQCASAVQPSCDNTSVGTIDFGFMSPDFTYVNSSFAERTISFNNIKVAPPGFNPTSPEYDPRQLQNCGSAQFRVIRMP